MIVNHHGFFSINVLNYLDKKKNHVQLNMIKKMDKGIS